MKNENENKNALITRDYLAIERTRLANERTFLAYLRTVIILLGSGVGLIKISDLSEWDFIGYILILGSPVLMAFAVYRFFRVKKRIREYYKAT